MNYDSYHVSQTIIELVVWILSKATIDEYKESNVTLVRIH